MQNAITQNPIRVNHVGFTSKGSKRFVLTDNQTGEDTFSIFQFSLMGEGDAAMCVLLNEDTEHLAFMLAAYGHANGGFLALCGAAELLGDKEFASIGRMSCSEQISMMQVL